MFKLLNVSDREKIHKTGRQILNEIGVLIQDKTVYSMMLEAGAVFDKNHAERVYIPNQMIEKYLSLCPKSFKLKNRKNEETEIKNGAASLYYTSNGTHYVRGTNKTAVDIGEREFVDFIKVSDKLENINGIVGTSIIDYIPAMRDVAGFRLMAQNSYKHLRPCIYTPAGAEVIIEMADVITEGKPLKENMFFSLGYSIVSPLAWSSTSLELFYRTRGHKIPLMINSEPMAGGTSPVTLAGCLALADAEVISGIIINQVIEPGRPCIYNAGFAHVMDMMTATVLTGSPENALLQAAGAEMAQYHNLPSASWALSDSSMLDGQASYEKMMTLNAHTMSGVNIIWGAGNFEISKAISPESAVIDNEMIGCCKQFNKGITVDEEQLAYDVIKDTVMNLNGSFLETDHTFENYREQIRHSRLPNRQARRLWEDKSSLSIEEKAESVVDNILKEKSESYLSGVQIDKLKKIEERYAERLGK